VVTAKFKKTVSKDNLGNRLVSFYATITKDQKLKVFEK
jgi:hypothetical protein